MNPINCCPWLTSPDENTYHRNSFEEFLDERRLSNFHFLFPLGFSSSHLSSVDVMFTGDESRQPLIKFNQFDQYPQKIKTTTTLVQILLEEKQVTFRDLFWEVKSYGGYLDSLAMGYLVNSIVHHVHYIKQQPRARRVSGEDPSSVASLMNYC